jgi:hypothetical protein
MGGKVGKCFEGMSHIPRFKVRFFTDGRSVMMNMAKMD